MRDIKFRAKRSDDGRWVYGDLVHTQKICTVTEKERTGKTAKCVIRVSNYDIDVNTIGQFTGLYDENEKEIYEGDIVDWIFFYTGWKNGGAVECDTTVRGIIELHQGGFILKVIENDFECAGQYGISGLNTDTKSDVTIIGNIYDNKELVNEQSEKNNPA